MDFLQIGIARGLIQFNVENTRITYLNRNKTYNFRDPEETVRAESYVQLIEVYGYASKRIDFEVIVPRRTPSDLADIVVFSNDEMTEPYIVVECKRETATDAEYKQAIEQGFGNANSLRASYLWLTSKTLNNYYDVSNFPAQERIRNIIADFPRFGTVELKQAKFYKGGIDEKGDRAFDIQQISQSDLTRKFKQAHDALWAGGQRNPSEAFDELDKLIFCKIRDEKTPRRNGVPYEFQVFTKEPPIELHKRITAIYDAGRVDDPEVFRDAIRLSPTELETIVGYLAPINLSDTDLDSKGRAFESFMGSFFRGEFGQYFTPRNVVDFIVDVLPITNTDNVLDPACGSSGFLLHILNKIRRQADDFYDPVAEEVRHHNYWHDFAKDKLYGIEISEQIARTAKMNMILHDDGHTNVLAHDGLKTAPNIESYARANRSRGHFNFKRDNFEHIATNPPFGSTIKANEKDYMADYDLGKKNFDWVATRLTNLGEPATRDSQKSEILFIEQCHKFLKPDGFLAIVLPDGILTNSSLQYVRDWIEEHFRLIGVVSLPQTAFSHTGAGVKSSVLFARKYTAEETIAIRSIKQGIQDELFGEDRYSGEFRRLEAEKAATIKTGDEAIQEINRALVNHIEALQNQDDVSEPGAIATGFLSAATKSELIRESKAKVKTHQQSEAYKQWRQAVSDDYNDKIEAVREALEDEFLEKVRQKVADYPIFMAIAEDIGYDATGRETKNNELVQIGDQLKDFIKAVKDGQDSFFASALI